MFLMIFFAFLQHHYLKLFFVPVNVKFKNFFRQIFFLGNIRLIQIRKKQMSLICLNLHQHATGFNCSKKKQVLPNSHQLTGHV